MPMVGIMFLPLQVQANNNAVLAGWARVEWTADAWKQPGRAVLNPCSTGFVLPVKQSLCQEQNKSFRGAVSRFVSLC